MSIQLQQQVYELLPVDDYKAVITDISESEGMYGPQLEFMFTIEGGQYDGALIKGWTSAKFSNRSKLYGWTKAAFGGKEIPTDYVWQSDHLLNRRVILTVVTKEKDDGTEHNKIERIKATLPPSPAEATKPTTPPPPAADYPPADDDDIPF